MKFIVISAPGKRFPEDKKVTDELIKLATLVINKIPYEMIQQDILSRYREITNSDSFVRIHISKYLMNQQVEFLCKVA